ncbi:hypothetical protein CR513_25108, partial [Mucuna pruriens]
MTKMCPYENRPRLIHEVLEEVQHISASSIVDTPSIDNVDSLIAFVDFASRDQLYDEVDLKNSAQYLIVMLIKGQLNDHVINVYFKIVANLVFKNLVHQPLASMKLKRLHMDAPSTNLPMLAMSKASWNQSGPPSSLQQAGSEFLFTLAGIQCILPKKCLDSGIFAVPCIIGGRTFTDAMLDLGASINSLNLADLEPTEMEVQLANRSVVQPLSVLEDVLVQVNERRVRGLICINFGTTIFYDSEDQDRRSCRDPFNGVWGYLHRVQVFKALKYPAEDHSTFSLDAIDGLMEEDFPFGTSIASLVSFVDKIDEARSDLSKQTKVVSDSGHPGPLLDRVSQPTPPTQKYVSPQRQATKLKPLPEHLKYAYLGDNQQFPIIIANNLHRDQEEKLLEVLKKHKKAIGWMLVDLPGINPSICMHKILLEEDARPFRQQSWRLNPTLLDVVKKEVTKLLAAGIIYPISDSHWVSPVQVVPKKSGITVIKNR